MIRRISPTQLAVDGVLGAVAVLLRLALAAPTTTFTIAVVLFGAAFALRRFAPIIALGVAWCAAVLQMRDGVGPDLANLAVLAVLYATARYGTRAVRWLGLGSAVLGALVAAIFLLIRSTPDGGFILAPQGNFVAQFFFLFIVFLSVLVLSWTVGLLARNVALGREARRTQAEAERVAVIEQERNRIARDMHDVVAHSLAVVIAQADGARYAATTDPGATSQALATIAGTAREALADVRLLLGALRAESVTAPQPTLADLPALIEQMRASGVDVRARLDGLGGRVLPTSHQLAVFRIAQEALTNALRHGDVGVPVELRLTIDASSIILDVTNALPVSPGPRALSAHPGPRGHAGHGLTGMAERAHLVGGRLETGIEENRFVVRLSVPLRSEESA